MVVEQGIGIQAIAKLGADEMSVEPVKAVPAEASATDVPQEVQPIQQNETVAEATPETVTPVEQQNQLERMDAPPDVKQVEQPDAARPPSEPEQPINAQIIASASGPQQEAVEEVDPVDVDQPVPEQVSTQQTVIEKPKQQVVKKSPPPQVAAE
jgi:hypothetical protein